MITPLVIDPVLCLPGLAPAEPPPLGATLTLLLAEVSLRGSAVYRLVFTVAPFGVTLTLLLDANLAAAPFSLGAALSGSAVYRSAVPGEGTLTVAVRLTVGTSFTPSSAWPLEFPLDLRRLELSNFR